MVAGVTETPASVGLLVVDTLEHVVVMVVMVVVVYGPSGASVLGTNQAEQGLQKTCPHKRQ